MKLTAFMDASAIVDVLGLTGAHTADVLAILEREDIRKDERIEFDVEVDPDEAYEKLDAEDRLPTSTIESTIEDAIDVDDLIDGLKAALAGDRHLAMTLFGRAFNDDSDVTRRIEESLRGVPRDHPTLPLLAAAE